VDERTHSIASTRSEDQRGAAERLPDLAPLSALLRPQAD
jgi:hypothetical protein